MTDEDCAKLTWPDGFCDIGNQTFEWTLINRPEWCDFTITSMSEPTGLFEKWRSFLLKSKYGKTKEIKAVQTKGEESI